MFHSSPNGSILNRVVLVLNTNYAPLDICTAKRAIILHYAQKVDILESYDDVVHSPSIVLSLPSIIKLRGYVKHNSLTVAMSRKNILVRDKHRCQYCGNKSGPLTLDHVIPREKGGGENWDNLVTACQPCNRKKGNRTPEEANMKLYRIPWKPNRIHYFQNFIHTKQVAWRPYLFLESF